MKEEKTGDLVPIERTLPQRIADAKGQVAAINELRKVALMLLKPKSLTNQGGEPYIRSNAAGLIGGRFGVDVYDMEWRPTETVIHNDGNPDEIVYTVDGMCRFDGNIFPVTGVATTRDNFFGKKTVNGVKVYKQYHEIDIASLKLKAVTRMRGNAARAALDLNSLDWPEVTTATGIKKEDVAGVNYGGGKATVTLTSNQEKKKEECREWLKILFHNDTAGGKRFMKEKTTVRYKDKKTGESKVIDGHDILDDMSGPNIDYLWKELSEMKNAYNQEANKNGAKQ
jgi:hypothetical protein